MTEAWQGDDYTSEEAGIQFHGMDVSKKKHVELRIPSWRTKVDVSRI